MWAPLAGCVVDDEKSSCRRELADNVAEEQKINTDYLLI